MTMYIHIPKLILNKYHLERIALPITQENMIVSCCMKNQKAIHSFRNMDLS